MSVLTPSSQTAEIPRPVDTIGSSGEAHRTGHVPELHIEVPDARSDSESSDEDDTDSEYRKYLKGHRTLDDSSKLLEPFLLTSSDLVKSNIGL